MKNIRGKEQEEERRVWKTTRINNRPADVFSNGYFDVLKLSL